MKTIVKCAAIIIHQRSLLLTRKRGTEVFISPGGKPLAGEDHLSCLKRELDEELGVKIKSFRPFGLFHGRAEFEAQAIENHVYFVEIIGQPRASHEIEEIAWVNYRKPPCEIAVGSIFRNNVIPLLFQQELIN
ncbi:NUDIX hydrolase [Erwinia pyrifoliae]|uniref:NUDIX domain-containing protein n=1 Tax=Erwinia pyrifoliae TaxID=79967 RepID=A0ABY5X529_ERWPY|nr:NUDIX domain-containing protein [Erwinia pyrifoliae]AUX71984.1 NUDIX domain-containing protein [Erwinia pyrifoliae]MCA8877775.1 NUDIX domain-containing protein [Erwinia pyrifoliae]MCT2388219.1 NUDIX domain-containing protein [Erwinia pyrifoliae]MCU8586389.1 NUDIX domain-containing protein [Erwinia pyrifoliae]UWS30291.1 NUDIX domain-containing protein [Erwinia pyrifoliae]